MSLTKEERQYWMDVLDQTGGQREVMLKERIIPKDYRAFTKLVDREEMILTLPGVDVPVRVIVTMAKDRVDQCPVHINMHGGGFIFPQNEDDDLYCAHVAFEIRGIVVDIDYATSDRYAYPVAFDQCYAVCRWTFAHLKEWNADPKQVSIGGSSAGGCLTASICLKNGQTRDFDFCLAILEYAATDNAMPIGDPKQLRSEAFSRLYTDGAIEQLKSPYISAFYAPDELLVNQPKTVILAAKNCQFYEKNKSYGMRLADAGTEVTFINFLNSNHGFLIRLTGEWREAQEAVIREIKKAGLC